MSGGWAGSDRRDRLPPNWNQLCGLVHKRSGRRCEFYLTTSQRCPNKADGGVDHIKRGDDHRLANLRDTCQTHHGKKSSQEGNDAKAQYKAARTREPEQHPREGEEMTQFEIRDDGIVRPLWQGYEPLAIRDPEPFGLQREPNSLFSAAMQQEINNTLARRIDETILSLPKSLTYRDPLPQTELSSYVSLVQQWAKKFAEKYPDIQHHTASRRNPMNEQSYPTFRQAGIEIGDECTVTLRDGTVVSGVFRGYESNFEELTVWIGGACLENLSGARWTLIKKKELPGQHHTAGLRSGQRVKIWLKPTGGGIRPTKIDGVFVHVQRLISPAKLVVELSGKLRFDAELIERLEVVA